MIELITTNWGWMIFALVIGLIIAWWIWSQPGDNISSDDTGSDDSSGISGAASGLMSNVKDTAVKAKDTAVDTTKKTADGAQNIAGDVSDTAKKTTKKASGAVAATAKKTTTTAKKAATKTVKTAKKTAAKPAAAAKKTANKTAKATSSVTKKVAGSAKKTTAAAAKKAASTTVKTVKKAPAKASASVKKTSSKAASTVKIAPKKATPKKTAKTVIPNDLELLKGVGPKLNNLLKSNGVKSFEQIAAWKAADIKAIDAKLGNFSGRITRDNWVDQAKLLTKGDVKGFEKKYGSLGSEIKK